MYIYSKRVEYTYPKGGGGDGVEKTSIDKKISLRDSSVIQWVSSALSDIGPEKAHF